MPRYFKPKVIYSILIAIFNQRFICMKKLSLFLSIFVLFFFSACSTPTLSNPFKSKVKKEYFTGGKLRSEFIMTDESGQNGLLKKYGYNGKLNSTVSIERGVKNGVETLFDQHGRVMKKTPYVHGKRQGVLEAYYPNGDVMAQITYVNNIRHGKAVKYNKDGSINQQVTFHNGRLSN